MKGKQIIQHKPITITLYDYLAYNVPADSYNLIKEYYNYPRPKDEEELVEQIKHFVRTQGEKGIRLLKQIHPDRELFDECEDCKIKDVENNALKENIKALETDKKIQEIASKYNYRNVTGETGSFNPVTNTVSADIKSINTNMFIMSAFILLGVAYLLKK